MQPSQRARRAIGRTWLCCNDARRDQFQYSHLSGAEEQAVGQRVGARIPDVISFSVAMSACGKGSEA
eukprot:7328299-Karenia_brevis.AAC.1